MKCVHWHRVGVVGGIVVISLAMGELLPRIGGSQPNESPAAPPTQSQPNQTQPASTRVTFDIVGRTFCGIDLLAPNAREALRNANLGRWRQVRSGLDELIWDCDLFDEFSIEVCWNEESEGSRLDVGAPKKEIVAHSVLVRISDSNREKIAEVTTGLTPNHDFAAWKQGLDAREIAFSVHHIDRYDFDYIYCRYERCECVFRFRDEKLLSIAVSFIVSEKVSK